MIVLRQEYALVFVYSDVWKPCQGMRGSLAKGWTTRDGGAKGTWKVSNYTEGVIGVPEGLYSREGKAEDGFV